MSYEKTDPRSVTMADVYEHLDMFNAILKHVLTHGHMTVVELGNILKATIDEREKKELAH
jgi:hypothetical protein